MTDKNNPATHPDQFTHLLDAAQIQPRTSAESALFGRSHTELADLVAGLGEASYRARQLAEGLYRQWITDLDDLSTWPRGLRKRLAEDRCIGRPAIQQSFLSSDGTERYLMRLADGETVETVWMPEGDGAEEDDEAESGSGSYKRGTICVSSQVGCAVNCRFCLTAKLGLTRSLTAGEIAGQVVGVLARQHVEVGRDRINLVFMGMGEPLLNCDAFFAAVRLLVEEVGLPEGRMTVSTSGIVPGIERYAAEPVRPRLAISLNAPNNEIRSEVMPVNRKWPIEAVLEAVRKVPLGPRERITFEYVLLGGVTDRPEHAQQLIRLVRRANLPLKVNLIVWNPGPEVPYTMPREKDVAAFKQALIEAGVPAFLRRPRGRDIYAACGQLKRTIGSL